MVLKCFQDYTSLNDSRAVGGIDTLDRIHALQRQNDLAGPGLRRTHPARHRSEEHTSELQSLMRISYAVFCLKKKKKPSNNSSTKMQKYINTSHKDTSMLCTTANTNVLYIT